MKKGEKTRAEIVEAATDVFFERGYSAATMRGIAERAGIQGGSIYAHFRGKQQLLFEIMSDTNQQLLSGLTATLDGLLQSEERLSAAIEYHVRFHALHYKAAIVADSEIRSLDPENYQLVTGQRKAYERYVQSLLRDGSEAGLLDVPDIRVVSYAILTASSAVALWYRATGQWTIDDVARMYADLFLKSLSK